VDDTRPPVRQNPACAHGRAATLAWTWST
jgi:hypothetical protein